MNSLIRSPAGPRTAMVLMCALALAALLAGCGQTGPLYLPEPTPMEVGGAETPDPAAPTPAVTPDPAQDDEDETP
jgi:predicted small lipoprotein YifL